MKFLSRSGLPIPRALRAVAVGVAVAVLAVLPEAHAQPAKNAPPTLGNTFVFSPPKSGQVLSIALREKLLKADARNLNRTDPALEEQLKKAENPYYRAQPPPPVTGGPAVGETTAPVPPPVVQLSDADRLKQVAERLQATGRFVVGGRGLLMISGESPLPVGRVIEVRFPNESAPSQIVLVSVDAAGYTLKLNDTALLFPYIAKPASGSRPAAPEAPPAEAPPGSVAPPPPAN